ncbi:SGNH/GDSL hydrolase family protein [Colwellia piezophila]|uniref:SGNH/GDSL hydrolase family protein n=1 Tax=Colwellia piezophila TaxID=211668 RepID=UPI0003627E0D|nr:SGNH/GDSL hydrolase family protein [Colwellia piezophila]
MRHVVLAGDSIFDNKPYVAHGDTVSDLMRSKLSSRDSYTLLAVDGHISNNVNQQLTQLPSDCSDLFISVGGNDALQNAYILNSQVTSVTEAFELFNNAIVNFKRDYLGMIDNVLKSCAAINCKNITLCTVYNNVPGLGHIEKTALALFNEVILDVAISFKLNVIDLRNTCDDEADYSEISPIEPSFAGGNKITDVIIDVIQNNKEQVTHIFQ